MKCRRAMVAASVAAATLGCGRLGFSSSEMVDAASDAASIDSGPPVPSATLVGYWSFDEGSGGTATDASGNGNDLSVGSMTWVPGQVGGAVQTPGSGSAPSQASLHTRGDLTVTAWYRLNSSTARCRTLVTVNNDTGGTEPDDNYIYEIYFEGNTQISYYHEYGMAIGDLNTVPAPVAAEADVWHHLAVVRVNATRELFFYSDGSLLARRLFTQPPDGGDAARLFVGSDGNGCALRGVIDELRVYDGALTETEISTLAGG